MFYDSVLEHTKVRNYTILKLWFPYFDNHEQLQINCEDVNEENG